MLILLFYNVVSQLKSLLMNCCCLFNSCVFMNRQLTATLLKSYVLRYYCRALVQCCCLTQLAVNHQRQNRSALWVRYRGRGQNRTPAGRSTVRNQCHAVSAISVLCGENASSPTVSDVNNSMAEQCDMAISSASLSDNNPYACRRKHNLSSSVVPCSSANLV